MRHNWRDSLEQKGAEPLISRAGSRRDTEQGDVERRDKTTQILLTSLSLSLSALNIQACSPLTFTQIFIQITFVKNIVNHRDSQNQGDNFTNCTNHTLSTLSIGTDGTWNQLLRDARRLNLLFSGSLC